MSNTADNATLAYDLAVACCGETFHVRRTLELARRVEQAMGPIYPLAYKLRTMAVTLEERATLIHTLLKDERRAPSIQQIREWLFVSGLRTGPELAAEMLTLVAGNDAVADYARRPRNGEGQEPDKSPFAPMAG
jgi:hypothetical protein